MGEMTRHARGTGESTVRAEGGACRPDDSSMTPFVAGRVANPARRRSDDMLRKGHMQGGNYEALSVTAKITTTGLCFGKLIFSPISHMPGIENAASCGKVAVYVGVPPLMIA